jgi:hypothetical protein
MVLCCGNWQMEIMLVFSKEPFYALQPPVAPCAHSLSPESPAQILRLRQEMQHWHLLRTFLLPKHSTFFLHLARKRQRLLLIFFIKPLSPGIKMDFVKLTGPM